MRHINIKINLYVPYYRWSTHALFIEAHNRLEGFNIKTEIVENGWHQPEEARGAPEDLTREIINMDGRYMHSFRRFYEDMLLKEPEPGIVIEDVWEDSLEDNELDIKNGG